MMFVGSLLFLAGLENDDKEERVSSCHHHALEWKKWHNIDQASLSFIHGTVAKKYATSTRMTCLYSYTFTTTTTVHSGHNSQRGGSNYVNKVFKISFKLSKVHLLNNFHQFRPFFPNFWPNSHFFGHFNTPVTTVQSTKKKVVLFKKELSHENNVNLLLLESAYATFVTTVWLSYPFDFGFAT